MSPISPGSTIASPKSCKVAQLSKAKYLIWDNIVVNDAQQSTLIN